MVAKVAMACVKDRIAVFGEFKLQVWNMIRTTEDFILVSFNSDYHGSSRRINDGGRDKAHYGCPNFVFECVGQMKQSVEWRVSAWKIGLLCVSAPWT
jgi:hypothetical protein